MKEHIKLRQEGDGLFKIKKYQDAIHKYEEALLHNTRYFTGHAHLAKALLLVDKYDEAIQQCQKALNIKDDYAYAYLIEGDAHKLKAETFLSLKNFEACGEECKKSEECYKTAIKYHEDDYKTGTLRLSALEKLEDLLNISIASKSTAASTDEEFDFDPEEDEDTIVVSTKVNDKNDITDNTLTAQKIVDIKITSEDTLALAKCIESNDVEFFEQFANKNNVTKEEAYSLLLTQIMLEHNLPDKKMTELFELAEPDLTIFNKYNGHSLISILLTFGTRDNVLFLKEYISKYDWEKVELDKDDQEAIHSTLLMGNALEVTQNEYVEFVMNLLGDICSEQSIHGALYE